MEKSGVFLFRLGVEWKENCLPQHPNAQVTRDLLKASLEERIADLMEVFLKTVVKE